MSDSRALSWWMEKQKYIKTGDIQALQLSVRPRSLQTVKEPVQCVLEKRKPRFKCKILEHNWMNYTNVVFYSNHLYFIFEMIPKLVTYCHRWLSMSSLKEFYQMCLCNKITRVSILVISLIKSFSMTIVTSNTCLCPGNHSLKHITNHG